MASKKEPYEVRVVNASWGDRKVNKLIKEGWEVVSDKGGLLMTARTVTLRRPNPKYKA